MSHTIVPGVLECGHCLVEGRSLTTFPCSNEGGEGRFKIMRRIEGVSDKEWEKDVSGAPALDIGPFSITPKDFYLAPGDSVDIKVHRIQHVVYSTYMYMYILYIHRLCTTID